MLQENLQNALNIVKVGCAERTTLPILKNVLIDFGTDGMVTLTTNDLETVTQYSFGCKVVSDPFSVCLPCKFLADVVNELHNDLIEVWQHKRVGDDRPVTSFKCNRQTANIFSIDPVDYPPIPKIEGQSIEVYDLADAVKKVKDLLTDSNGNRWEHRQTEGLLFDLEKGLIVATDRKRMKAAHINATAPGMKFRISKKAATMLLKFKDTVNITYQPKIKDRDWSAVKFECKGITIITQDLETTNGKYPDYQSIIEKEENKNLVEVY